VAQSQKAGGTSKGFRKPIQWLAARSALRQADLALAWAPHIAEDMVSLGCPENKIFVLPRGVDLTRFPFKPKKPSDGLSFVSTRGLNRGYNLKTILRAMQILSRKVEKFRYVVVGDGEERRKLVRLADILGIGHQVEFVGNVPYDYVQNYLYDSDIYVSPVPEDGVSSSLLEAMATGTFPIVSDIAANRYWETLGARFLFFSPYKVENFVDRVLEYYNGAESFRRHLKGNRQIVEKEGSWVTNMKRLDNIFSSIVKR
jgi:glycosyltransferase involved in cell wall biosynthesis